MPAQTERSFCRVCQSSCGLKIEIDGGKVLSVRGDKDHPITKGFMCVKGGMSQALQNGEDRLVQTLGRDGQALRPIATNQALDEIAARLSAILDRHGPRALAVYYGTGSKMNVLGVQLMRSWLFSLGSPNLYSSSTVDQSAKWVTQSRMGQFTSGKFSIIEADVALICGANPVVSHPGRGPLLHERKRAGKRLIVIDPRQTETARLADIHLQPRPNQDAAIFAGMIRLIFENGWADEEFLARYAEHAAELRKCVEPFTLDHVAARADIPADRLVEATRMFATASRRVAESGTGPDMAARSNLAEHLLEALNAVCGVYRRAGDRVTNPSSFQPNRSPREGVVPPARTWEQEPKLRTVDSGLLMGEFPSSLLPDEITNPGEDRIRALVIFGGDPVTSLSDGGSMAQAMRGLELSVTLDCRLTETGRRSDYVIPTALPYERYEISMLGDYFAHTPYLQLARPLLAPPAGVLEDWEVFWEIAARMNRSIELKVGGIVSGILGNGPAITLRPDSKPTSEALHRWMVDGSAASWDELLAHPSGISIVAEEIIVGHRAPGEGTRLDLCPPDVAEEIAQFRRDEDDDPSLPYRLLARRMLETMNGAFKRSSTTRRRYPYNPAFMNPDDMADEGIAAGDRIVLRSAHGSIIARAQPDRSLRRGLISMSHQWGRIDKSEDPEGEEGSFTGHLVSLKHPRETINFMPRQSGIPVAVETLARPVAVAGRSSMGSEKS